MTFFYYLLQHWSLTNLVTKCR